MNSVADVLDTYNGFDDRSTSSIGLAGYDEWKTGVGPWPGGDDYEQPPAAIANESSADERDSTMPVRFQKATKEQSRLRCALFGPSGSGKTYSALSIAEGLGGSIALVDSEHGSASKYADRFSFDVCNLGGKTIADYIEVIDAASGYDVLIIDSLSHAWQELLEEVDKLAKAKYKGNTWSAWSDGTPKQRTLVNALLQFPGHVLATMRSKTEWVTEKDERTGKSAPKRVGLAPEQGKGIEYEFDLLVELSAEHFATILKDRTGKFQDQIIEKPGKAFGAQLAAWLSTGEPMKPIEKPEVKPQVNGHSKWQIECGALLASLKAAGDSRFSSGPKMLAHLVDWAHARGFDAIDGEPISITGLGSLTEEQREKYASTLTDLLEERKTAKAGA